MSQVPATSQQSQTLKSITALVSSWIKPDASVRVHSYYLGKSARDPYEGYIEIDDLNDPHRYGSDTKRYRNTPGIPLGALVPEKAEAIAKWVANQIYKMRPEWFITP